MLRAWEREVKVEGISMMSLDVHFSWAVLWAGLSSIDRVFCGIVSMGRELGLGMGMG